MKYFEIPVGKYKYIILFISAATLLGLYFFYRDTKNVYSLVLGVIPLIGMWAAFKGNKVLVDGNNVYIPGYPRLRSIPDNYIMLSSPRFGQSPAGIWRSRYRGGFFLNITLDNISEIYESTSLKKEMEIIKGSADNNFFRRLLLRKFHTGNVGVVIGLKTMKLQLPIDFYFERGVVPESMDNLKIFLSLKNPSEFISAVKLISS